MVPALVKKFLVSSVRARPTSASLQVPSRVSSTAKEAGRQAGAGGGEWRAPERRPVSRWVLVWVLAWVGGAAGQQAACLQRQPTVKSHCAPLEPFTSKWTVL